MAASRSSTTALVVLAFTPVVAAYFATAGPSLPEADEIAALASGWSSVRIADTEDAAVTSRIQDVELTETGLGLLIAPNGRLWRSADAGRTWQRVDLRSEVGMGVALRADGVGLATGVAGAAARTSDGGLTWQTIETGADAVLGLPVWIDEHTALTSGQVVLRSTDGGLTWSRVTLPEVNYYSAAFVEGGRGIMVGSAGLVVRTEDGGATWAEQWLPTRAMLRGIAWVDAARAVVVGSSGTILRSEDGGLSWTDVASPTDQHLRAVAFHGEHGVIAGFAGTILRSDDGGTSWRVVPSGTRMHLFAATWSPDGAPIVAGWGNTVLRGPRVDAAAGTREVGP